MYIVNLTVFPFTSVWRASSFCNCCCDWMWIFTHKAKKTPTKYLCQAGWCSLCKAKYYDVLSCLSVGKDGFKNTLGEKYFLLCSRPNVQPGRSALGTLVKMPLGHTFCCHLNNSSRSLASCKEPTRAKGSLDEWISPLALPLTSYRTSGIS